MINLISWQKWLDPFGSDDAEELEHDPYLADYEEQESVTDNTMSGKIFNFWIGHTNFDITHKVADVIEKTDGVETLDIFTRYRFRIAVGKAFDDSSVMRDINKRVYSELS
jgi:hypothetical protein